MTDIFLRLGLTPTTDIALCDPSVPCAQVAAIGGGRRRRGRPKRRKPDWQVVAELTRDVLGPEPGVAPIWERSEQDLADLILLEHL